MQIYMEQMTARKMTDRKCDLGMDCVQWALPVHNVSRAGRWYIHCFFEGNNVPTNEHMAIGCMIP